MVVTVRLSLRERLRLRLLLGGSYGGWKERDLAVTLASIGFESALEQRAKWELVDRRARGEDVDELAASLGLDVSGRC